MATRIEEPRQVDDAPFNARDLITTAGVGSNGELLVNTLAYHYPPELESALGKRVNAELTRGLADPEKAPGKALAKFLSAIDVERIEDVRVRGGVDESGRNINPDAAHVIYVRHAGDGHTFVKGTVPYRDLLDGEYESHVSQSESMANSPAAQEHNRRREIARDAERKGIAGRPAASASTQNPVELLSKGSASEILALMERSSSKEVEAIKAFETAARGDRARKAIVEYEPDEPENGSDGDENSGDVSPAA